MKSSRILFYTLTCIGVAAVCLCGGGGALMYRYVSAGVNPFREIKLATLGESIEIKEHLDQGLITRQLTIDGIDHGGQIQPKSKLAGGLGQQLNWTRMPTTYYHPAGPIGIAMSSFNWFPMHDDSIDAGDARLPASLVAMSGLATTTGPWCMLAATWSEPPVGIIMMNNGTLAAYARPYQFVDIYERNPKVVQLSIPTVGFTPDFTYIDDAKKRGAHIRIFEGNERKTFDKDAPKHFYHVVIVDTARGHPGLPSKDLLTKEAIQGFLNSMVDDGIVCFHTSSRDYRLSEVVASSSSQLQLAHVCLHDGMGDRITGHYTSEWVAVARKAETLRFMKNMAARRNQMKPGKLPHETFTADQLPINPALFWTDAGANSLTPARR